MPVIVGALSMIKKGIDKYINKIPGSTSPYEIQKIVLYRTSHFLEIGKVTPESINGI